MKRDMNNYRDRMDEGKEIITAIFDMFKKRKILESSALGIVGFILATLLANTYEKEVSKPGFDFESYREDIYLSLTKMSDNMIADTKEKKNETKKS